jgi:hypothetical protein
MVLPGLFEDGAHLDSMTSAEARADLHEGRIAG